MKKCLFAGFLLLAMVFFMTACEKLCLHIRVTDPAVAATCAREGLTEGSHCALCQAILTEQKKIPQAEHVYQNAYRCHCGAYFEEAKITVLSQNVRYRDDGDGNDINDRAPRFKALVEKYSPDLIGTQETTPAWNGHFKSYFKGIYGMVGCSREGKDATKGEWGTILYRLDRFELLDSGDFWLTDTPEKPSKVSGAACNRICTWALLKDKVTGKSLVFANTHLDHLTASVRDQQTGYLLAGLAEFVGNYPLYLTGDFNSTPDSAVYSAVTGIFLDARTTAPMGSSSDDRTFDSYGIESPGQIIDYCFYDDRSEIFQYQVLKEQFDGYVSDHYGVLAEYIIK